MRSGAETEGSSEQSEHLVCLLGVWFEPCGARGAEQNGAVLCGAKAVLQSKLCVCGSNLTRRRLLLEVRSNPEVAEVTFGP